MNALIISDISIRQDAEGRYCLNDLHKAAGGYSTDRPSKWLDNDGTRALINEIDAEKLASEQNQAFRVYKGGNGWQGTFVCKELVYAYAMWISPTFHLKVIRAYDAMVNKAPTTTAIPQTFSEALKLAYEQALVIERQQTVIAQKDQYIIASNEASVKAGEVLVREFVKSNDLIDIGEKQFYAWMREQGLVLKNSCEPASEYVKRGYFTWKPTLEEYGGKIRHTLRITPRGKIWLAARYLEYLDRQPEVA